MSDAASVWQVCPNRTPGRPCFVAVAVRPAAGPDPEVVRTGTPSPDVPHGGPNYQRGPVATPSARSDVVSAHHTLLSDLSNTKMQCTVHYRQHHSLGHVRKCL